jgi:hypothetical protein
MGCLAFGSGLDGVAMSMSDDRSSVYRSDDTQSPEQDEDALIARYIEP